MLNILKFVGAVIGTGAFLIMLWAMIWVACAMSDQCWYSYTGQL